MRMVKPNISIIIPVYNAEKFLEMTLTSVVNQTYGDFEVICINDGSKDSSQKILENFADKDERFRIYYQENQGGSCTRNNALDMAQGSYIAFLDNDDLYHPQYLEILYQNMIKYGADVSACSYQEFEENEEFYFSQITEEKMDTVKLISNSPFIDKFKKKKKIPMLMWTKLYKADILKGIRFSPNLPAINDVLLNMEILMKSKKLVLSSYSLIAYRQVSTSQNRAILSEKKLNEYKSFIEEVMTLASRQKDPKIKKILENLATKNGWWMLVKDNLRDGKYIGSLESYDLTLKLLNELREKQAFRPKYLKLTEYWRYKQFMARKFIV